MKQQLKNEGIPAGLWRSVEESERMFSESLDGLGLSRQQLGALAGRMRKSLGAGHHLQRRPRVVPGPRQAYRGGFHV